MWKSTRVYDDMLEMLSNADNPTPMVRLNRATARGHAGEDLRQARVVQPVRLRPDRVAANLIKDAGEKGLLEEGQQIVEPTSGNTGMGLAMMANAKGYSLTTPLSNKIPAEKRVMLKMFGTNVEELEDDL